MKIFKEAVFWILVFLIAYMVLEVCSRLNVYYHYNRDIKKFDNPLMKMVNPVDRREYDLKKNVRFVDHNGIIYETNGKGLRGTKYLYEKPNGTCRILMVGDSYLFGWGIQWKDTMPLKLEQLLNKEPIESGRKYEVINAGICGYDTVQESEFFKKEGIKYNPDTVILYFVVNDMEPQWSAPRHPKYEYEYCRSWFLDHLVRRINHYIEKFSKNKEPKFVVYRNRHNPQYLRGLDKETYKRDSCEAALLGLASIVKSKGMDFYVFIVPDFGADLKNYPWLSINDEIVLVCKKNNIKVVDLVRIFSNKDTRTLRVSEQEMHPNGMANDIIAKEIYAVLKNNRKN